MCYTNFVEYETPKVVEGYKAVYFLKESLSFSNLFKKLKNKYYSYHTGVEYKENSSIPKIYENRIEARKNIPDEIFVKLCFSPLTPSSLSYQEDYKGSGIFEDLQHCKSCFPSHTDIIKIKGRAIGEANYFGTKIFLIDFIYLIQE